LINGTGLPNEYLEFCGKMNNDLNVSEALGVFFTWMKSVKKKIIEKQISIKGLGEAWMFLSIFNNIFDFIDMGKSELPHNVKIILKKRMEARALKDYALSDRLREELLVLGWKVDDSKQGQEAFKNK
jgi:cysteinyl-tRNA synthetase